MKNETTMTAADLLARVINELQETVKDDLQELHDDTDLQRRAALVVTGDLTETTLYDEVYAAAEDLVTTL